MEILRKKKETNKKHNGRSLQQTRTAEDRLSELEDEMEIKGKLKNYYSNNSKLVKGICKNSPTPSKDQT
jgi:hypothetical protein